MKKYTSLTKGRKAVKVWGRLKTFLRSARGKFIRSDKNSAPWELDVRMFRNSLDGDDDGSENDIDGGDDSHSEVHYWSSCEENAAPMTNPRRIIPPADRHRLRHGSDERMHDMAYRYDISPDAPPQTQHDGVVRRRQGPGPEYNHAFIRATNLRLLHRDQPFRDWRNERRDTYNRRGSPLGRKGRGSDVLARYCDSVTNNERGLMGERIQRGREEVVDRYVTDITTRPPPKFDLGAAAARSTVTPVSREDPF